MQSKSFHVLDKMHCTKLLAVDHFWQLRMQCNKWLKGRQSVGASQYDATNEKSCQSYSF